MRDGSLTIGSVRAVTGGLLLKKCLDEGAPGVEGVSGVYLHAFALQRAMAKAYPDTDVLVFGHSHIPWDTTAPRASGQGGLRLLNPGSPTDRRRQPHCTYMTATIDGGALGDVELHRL